jgi:hypothetical protein
MKHVVPKNRWRDLRTGFTAAHDFIWRRTEVTAMEKALWLHSCRVAWDTGIYWESRGGAREALGFTKGQIHDTRRRLIELGLWELDRVRDDGVRFYRIMAPHDWTPG